MKFRYNHSIAVQQDGDKKQEKPRIPGQAPGPMPDEVLQAKEKTEKSKVRKNKVWILS